MFFNFTEVIDSAQIYFTFLLFFVFINKLFINIYYNLILLSIIKIKKKNYQFYHGPG